jgi:hypothetical protein
MITVAVALRFSQFWTVTDVFFNSQILLGTKTISKREGTTKRKTNKPGPANRKTAGTNREKNQKPLNTAISVPLPIGESHTKQH